METEKRWIPVTERSPKHGEICICYLTFGEMRILQWGGINYWWLGCGKGYDWQKKHITHWMPLPEPPKQDKPSCDRCANDGMDVPQCKECAESGFRWFREKV